MEKSTTLELNNISFEGDSTDENSYIITPVSTDKTFEIPLKLPKFSYVNIGKHTEVYQTAISPVIEEE